MKRMILVTAVWLVGAGGAGAQPAPPSNAPTVEVDLGPAVQAREGDLGRGELEAQRSDLQREVARAVARQGAAIRSVRLTIQDIQPSRPTSAQLGASPGLSASSIGLGGAAVTGEVVGADGAVHPVRYRYFPQNLALETDFTPWGGAQGVFTKVADGIAKGAPPDQAGAWPPPHRSETPTGTLIRR